MEIEFDPEKDAVNLKKHGIFLARASEVDLIRIVEDNRFDYGEDRFLGYGRIKEQIYCLCFTERRGKIRGISLRRAHEKEYRHYVFE